MEPPAPNYLSQVENCRRLAALRQKSADEAPPGPEQERHQVASDKFLIEADDLAFQALLQALLWPLKRI
jgi:hypothetical protein